MPGFTHLHVASGYSLRFGTSHPEQLVARAAELGQQALALTDRDGAYGAVVFAQACAQAGISPILGVRPRGRPRRTPAGRPAGTARHAGPRWGGGRPGTSPGGPAGAWSGGVGVAVPGHLGQPSVRGAGQPCADPADGGRASRRAGRAARPGLGRGAGAGPAPAGRGGGTAARLAAGAAGRGRRGGGLASLQQPG